VFLGTHSPRLDEKGRLALPAKYRADLADGVVVTKGQEGCLYVFTRQEFVERAQALRTAPLTSRTVRTFSRMYGAEAHDDVPDKQGRITIPAQLRTWAGLDRDVCVVGAISRLEIWEPQKWADYSLAQEPGFSDHDEQEVVRELF
jgi:MraZ protein